MYQIETRYDQGRGCGKTRNQEANTMPDHETIRAQTPALFLARDLTGPAPPLGGWPIAPLTVLIELRFVAGNQQRHVRYRADSLPDGCAIAECLAFLSGWRLIEEHTPKQAHGNPTEE